MSNKMLTLAWDTEVATVAMKCLLLSLADHHNDKTNLCFPGITRLAKRTSMSRQSVINNTKKLEDAGLIAVQKDAGDGRGAKSNKYTLHLGQSQKDLLPTKSKRLTTPKVKEIEGKVNIIKRQSQGDRRQSQGDLPEPLYNPNKEPLVNQSRSNDFDRWWSIYPKKVGKKPAQTAWKRIKPDADVLIADIQERLARDDQWKRGFVPNPTTYLNQERWTDELQQPKRNESTPADEYAARVTRENEIISKLNGGSMAVDGEVVSPTVDEEQRGDRITCLPRLDA